jgi:hypothetical protein
MLRVRVCYQVVFLNSRDIASGVTRFECLGGCVFRCVEWSFFRCVSDGVFQVLQAWTLVPVPVTSFGGVAPKTPFATTAPSSSVGSFLSPGLSAPHAGRTNVEAERMATHQRFCRLDVMPRPPKFLHRSEAGGLAGQPHRIAKGALFRGQRHPRSIFEIRDTREPDSPRFGSNRRSRVAGILPDRHPQRRVNEKAQKERGLGEPNREGRGSCGESYQDSNLFRTSSSSLAPTREAARSLLAT